MNRGREGYSHAYNFVPNPVLHPSCYEASTIMEDVTDTWSCEQIASCFFGSAPEQGAKFVRNTLWGDGESLLLIPPLQPYPFLMGHKVLCVLRVASMEHNVREAATNKFCHDHDKNVEMLEGIPCCFGNDFGKSVCLKTRLHDVPCGQVVGTDLVMHHIRTRHSWFSSNAAPDSVGHMECIGFHLSVEPGSYKRNLTMLGSGRMFPVGRFASDGSTYDATCTCLTCILVLEEAPVVCERITMLSLAERSISRTGDKPFSLCDFMVTLMGNVDLKLSRWMQFTRVFFYIAKEKFASLKCRHMERVRDPFEVLQQQVSDKVLAPDVKLLISKCAYRSDGEDLKKQVLSMFRWYWRVEVRLLAVLAMRELQISDEVMKCICEEENEISEDDSCNSKSVTLFGYEMQ